MSRSAPSVRYDETIVIGDEDDDQDEEPAPSRYESKPFVDNDDAEQTERRVIEWSLAGFLVSTRRLVSEWRDRCPDEERSEMAQVLRDLADQIDNG